MRRAVIKQWTRWHNPSRVNRWVALIIMLFDVIHDHGFRNPWHLIKITQVTR